MCDSNLQFLCIVSLIDLLSSAGDFTVEKPVISECALQVRAPAAQALRCFMTNSIGCDVDGVDVAHFELSTMYRVSGLTSLTATPTLEIPGATPPAQLADDMCAHGSSPEP